MIVSKRQSSRQVRFLHWFLKYGYQRGYQNKKIGSPKTRKALFNASSSFLAFTFQGSG